MIEFVKKILLLLLLSLEQEVYEVKINVSQVSFCTKSLINYSVRNIMSCLDIIRKP